MRDAENGPAVQGGGANEAAAAGDPALGSEPTVEDPGPAGGRPESAERQPDPVTEGSVAPDLPADETTIPDTAAEDAATPDAGSADTAAADASAAAETTTVDAGGPDTATADAGGAETTVPDASTEASTAPEATPDGSSDEAVEAPPAPELPPPALVTRTVSQEIARQLYASGARFCFTVPGESFLPFIDDLAAVGIRIVTTRHEGGAAFMAEALAQSTGRPQIVAVSRGPGATNASIGIHTAQQDSAPLVALVGQVGSEHLGREAFQEMDLVNGIGSMASWAAQIDRPEQTRSILDTAWKRLNVGRPGPILLAVPRDVQTMEVEVPDVEAPKPPGARGPAADRSAVRRAMKMLAASERGVIVAGGGVLRARATKRLVTVSEALAVPVVAAWRRPDVFPNDHANYLGMAGFWSASTVPQRLRDADVILFIGTRLSKVTTHDYTIPGPDTRWIHVDVEPRVAHAGLEAPTLSIAADASRFLDTAWSDLRGAALDNEMRSRREARIAADREAYKAASDVAAGEWVGPGVHPGRVVAVLRAVLPDNATLTTDAGNHGGWVARGFRFRRAGTFIGPTSGAMGFGIPAATAASLQDPDRIAVGLCGDGGFSMTMMEIETAVRCGAHPIILVFDNESLGTIAMGARKEGRPTEQSDLGPLDFAAAARAMGALGFSVSEDAAFEPALREAIASRQTSVIHLKLDRAWASVDENPVATGV